MNQKWLLGIAATLAAAWIMWISSNAMANSEDIRAMQEILPRIEAKVDQILKRLQ